VAEMLVPLPLQGPVHNKALATRAKAALEACSTKGGGWRPYLVPGLHCCPLLLGEGAPKVGMGSLSLVWALLPSLLLGRHAEPRAGTGTR